MPDLQNIFVATAGNIGSGKSSLTKLLSEHYGWHAFFESVDDNPYLSDFYRDMKRWSFHLQVYFLSKRFQDHRRIVEGRGSVIQDRSIYEDAEIFARNLYELGEMDERDYTNYRALYAVMSTYLKPPDLLIFLDARIDTLMTQISKRGREFEQSIRRDYIEQLDRHYHDWVKRYSLGPLLVVPSDQVDFVHERGDFNRVLMLVQAKLLELGYEAGPARRAPVGGKGSPS